MMSERRALIVAMEGYSVLEMLVVLAIIGSAVAIAQPSFRGVPEQIQLRTAAQGVLSALKSTRAAAIARNRDLALVFDLDRREYSSAAISTTALPKTIRLELKVANLSAETSVKPTIWFFPDGSSTGGDLVLKSHERSSHICINWLTGIPRDDGDCL